MHLDYSEATLIAEASPPRPFRPALPTCGTKVQRIRYSDNETNYCPRCQMNGRILADRSLSRLLKDDWPRKIEELES